MTEMTEMGIPVNAPSTAKEPVEVTQPHRHSQRQSQRHSQRRGIAVLSFALLTVLLVGLIVWWRSPSREAVLASDGGDKALAGTLTVFAASSLQEAFRAIATDFQGSYPGVEMVFNFAGSNELRLQIEQGAPADVFASADSHQMAALVASGRVSHEQVFVRNLPVLVVSRKADNPVFGFADLPAASRVSLGALELPAGRYAALILDRASAKLGADFRERVESKVISRERNVRQVLTKVALGEAQAGIVYQSDVVATKSPVDTIAIPAEFNVLAEYPIAVTTGTKVPRLARAWLEQVLSQSGQARLKQAGYMDVKAELATP